MSRTFEEYQTRVLRVYKRTDKTQEIKDALNDCYKEMIGILGPRKLQDQVYKTCVIGREEYPVPSNLLRIHHPIKIIDPDTDSSSTGSFPLRFITKAEYDFYEPNPNASSVSTGQPWAYTIWKNSILLTDIPDKAYVLEMSIGGEATELSEDSDESIFSEQWDETVIAGALKRLYGNIRQYKDSLYWQGVYQNGHAGDGGELMGGIKLLKQIIKDNTQAVLIVKPNNL